MSWFSKNQPVVALSTAEAEYVSLKADLQYDARPAYRQFLIKSVGDLTF